MEKRQENKMSQGVQEETANQNRSITTHENKDLIKDHNLK